MAAPDVSTILAMKLGSIAVHAKELISPDGHALDRSAIEGLLNDTQVKEWLKEMTEMALVPVMRE